MFAAAARYQTDILATLAQSIRSYQVYKHAEIFDPLIAGDDAQCATIARGMKQMCIAAAAGGRAFILLWSGRSVGADWPDYSAATLAMNDAIRQHLEAERRGFVELEAAIRRAPSPISARVR